MESVYDLIIIGGGPAGLSAAIYAGRARLRTLILEEAELGGQIRITADVVNYPGIFKTDGAALTAEMKRQAERFGVSFAQAKVTGLDAESDIKTVKCSDGREYASIAIIIATGAKPRKLGFEGEAKFTGRGVAYCATCDGEFFTGADVYAIGAGYAAAEESLFLTRFAKRVVIIAREPEFTCPKSIADEVLAHPKIEVKFNSEIIHARGDNDVLGEAKFINNETGEEWTRAASEDGRFGIFVFIGYEPDSSYFRNIIETDRAGYIITNEDMETTTKGVYAAGDIRPKRLRQLATAVSDGALAGTNCQKYIEDLKKRLNIQIDSSVAKPREEAEKSNSELNFPGGYFSEESARQARAVYERFTGKIEIKAVLDDSPLSSDIRAFLDDFSKVSSIVPVEIFKRDENLDLERAIKTELFPVIALFKNGAYTRVCFHAAPGGHELETFILALYNAAGPGQPINDATKASIASLKAMRLKVGISLTCSMCPETAQACIRVALNNPNIETDIIDLTHFTHIREERNILSVPALIIDDRKVIFGKKNLEQVIQVLE